MKIKTLLIFLVIVVLSGIANGSLHATDNANVAIKNIEYLTGDDFVQLHFKIGQMVPIPDVLPPVNGDNTRIIMRMSDLGVAMKKSRFTFESAIIDFVKLNAVDHGGSNKLVEVEIRLKEQVNYRIFSNQKGVYIEFPNLKDISLTDTDKIAGKNKKTNAKPNLKPNLKQKTKPKNIPSENLALLNKKNGNVPPLNKTKSEKKKKQPPKLNNSKPKQKMAYDPQPKPPNNVSFDPNDMPADKSAANNGSDNQSRTVIKDIVLKEKDAEHVKFEVLMNGHPDFNVIPIPDSPVRLAIDFKDTQCRALKKAVNFLNVKQIRGAHNTPSIYRVVFDLKYLNNYKVSTKSRNGSVVEIEFFNDDYAPKKKALAKNKKPSLQKKKAPAKKMMAQNRKKKNQTPKIPAKETLNNNPVKKKNPPALKKQQKKNVMAQNKQRRLRNKPKATPKLDENPRVITAGNPPSSIVVKSDANGINLSNIEAENATPLKVDNQSNPNSITISNEDFFEDEKSQVTMNKNVSSQTKKPTSSEKKESGVGMQMKFLKKTIDEGEKEYIGDRMSFNFHNADLKDVITIIARISGKNIVLDPGVSGRVTSQLKNVPWDQALELFLKTNKLDAIEEGNILRVGNVNDLASEAEARQKLKKARQLEGDLSVVTRTLSFAQVGKVVPILKNQLSQRGEILQDDRSNTLIISEVPSRIEVLDKLIDTLDTPNPQVSIEARVVETRANFIESMGIQWGYNFVADSAYGNQTTLKFPNSVTASGNQFTSTASPLVGPLGGYAVNLPANGATSGTLFSVGNVADTFRLDVALSAMQSKGNAKVISSPKTSTQNNMEATIMQGKMIPVQVIQNNTITVVYRPAVLELKVTPQITSRGTIICELSIDNNSADFANLVNGIPPIITQSIKTTVMVDDGGTVVIGGMYKVEKSSTKDGVPVLSKLPILGNLFRSNSQRSEQKEVLIFITPRIIK
jgi:type IV pilus secretin PilQ/predicted competence protein